MRYLAILLASALALSACGSSQPSADARAFCATHGGVSEVESDGDATCADGAEYENPADNDSKKKSKSKKKVKR